MDTAQNHAFVAQQTARGEVADFSAQDGYNIDAKPVVEADFLRKLLLGQPDAAGVAPQILLPGVRIKGARVEGWLDLTDCSGAGNGLPALALDNCDIVSVIDVSHARLARLSITGSRFRALSGIGVRIDGDFDFSDATPLPVTAGQDDGTAYIWMPAARVGGGIWGRNATLRAPQQGSGAQPTALMLQSTVGGGICALNGGFLAIGRVSLLGARFLGSLECDNGHFENPGGDAMIATNTDIGGAILFRDGFIARGKVSLIGAKVGSTLDCSRGRFENPNDDAIVGANLQTGGDVLIRDGFGAVGKVSLFGAKIAEDLELCRSVFSNKGGDAITLNTVRIEGRLYAIENTVEGAVDMSGTRVGRLMDDPDTAWHGADAVILNETSYEHLGSVAGSRGPYNWKARVDWLKRNTGPRFGRRGAFSNQPWRECAAAFARAGRHEAARRIARAEQSEANSHRSPVWQRPLVWLLAEQPFGYGLSVARAAATALVFWLVGSFGAEVMLERGVLVDSNDRTKACTAIAAPLYALDVAVPVLDLRQESACEPGRGPQAKNLLPGRALPNGLGMFGEEIALWRWAKALYAVFGAAVVGFAILTFSGVFRPRE